MNRRIYILVAICAAMISIQGSSIPAYGQVGTATLSGTVTDPSDALVPNASVVLEGTETKSRRVTVSDAAGLYVIPAIKPGVYRLTVTASGFSSKSLTDILLRSGQSTTLNVALAIGAQSQTVDVKATAPLLQTGSASLGAEISPVEMTKTPLLGRNFTSLIGILPGAGSVPDNHGDNSSVNKVALNPSMYGQRQRDNDYTLDGVVNNEPLFSTIGIYPPPEAIAEMKVESGSDSGAVGWASGANINIVTKSGTNNYHGNAWEYFRDSSTNARTYFIPSVGLYKWHQFGATFGGPFALPHLLPKSKSWYIFGYYEGIRLHSASNATSLVPTVAERGGDFSADPAIYNPYTTPTGSGGIKLRQQFPNNQIPMGATNLCAPQPTCVNASSLTILKQLYPTPNLPDGAVPGANYIDTAPSIQDGDQWSVRIDHQFGSKDDFYARYSDSLNTSSTQTLPTLPTNSRNRYMNVVVSETHAASPTFLFTTRFGMQRVNGQALTGGPGGGIGPQNTLKDSGLLDAFGQFQGKNQNYDLTPSISIPGYASIGGSGSINGPEYYMQWTEDIQKIAGKNEFAFGGRIMRSQFFTNSSASSDLGFTSTQTGNSSARTGSSFASFLLGLPNSADRVGGDTSAYMHGNAYSLYLQDTLHLTKKLTLNLGVRWDYASPLINDSGSGTFVWETGQYLYNKKSPITGEPPNAPRGMFPPDYTNIVPRIGIAYALDPKTVVRSSYGVFYDTFGINYAQSQQGNRGNWPFAFPQTVSSVNLGLPTTLLPNPFPGPLTGSPTPLGCAQCLEVARSATRTPYVQEWTFSIQRQLAPSLRLQAAYFGSHGVHLSSQIIDNTAVTPGTTPYQTRQKWPQIPPYTSNGYNQNVSFYDGLSLELNKRYSHNFSVLAAYTYSKAIDTMDSLQNALNATGASKFRPTRFNFASFRGAAGFDIRHKATAGYVVSLPSFTTHRFFNAIVGGWGHSGIITVDSGLPYYVALTTDNENIGTSSGQFPNIVGNPALNQRSITKWFDTSAFALPAYGTAGNLGKHAYYSQHLFNWDSSISKSWPLFREPQSIEFRADFFNTANSHSFSAPGSQFGTSQFGKISAARQPGRQLQFGLLLNF
ncbi:MAG: TonB-dependent receptor [Acidobacteria bacterium]|nr:TonB-dependent receptor [Acidobacteriota bacterium]